ncbi:MAG: hypothetical protein M0P39_06910 [Rhodocyclaceae bacterium]|nr:hypothetical protein [Rhodocyclaceae bacterium]
MKSIAETAALNAVPLGGCLDRARASPLLARCPGMFSDTRVFLAATHLRAMAEAVAAIERAAQLPGWQQATLGRTEEPAVSAGGRGVFFGYDFHITAAGPQLIEINTNAGGALINIELLRAQRADTPAAEYLPNADELEDAMFRMFIAEWQAAGRDGRPARIAIVDDSPAEQFFLPEFEMARDLFRARGIEALICDPTQLDYRESALWFGGRRVDLVYNRLTDFALKHPAHRALSDACAAAVTIVTPDPRTYALFADKRNLVLLSDAAWLRSIGVAAADRAAIAAVVPTTEIVVADRGEELWQRRKGLFFKPASGYGSKAVYRGLNVTRGVFVDILAGDYVAQALVPPATRKVFTDDGAEVDLKYDLRCYAYAGKLQLIAARLWQGQTTNFRTPGGGFAPAVVA